MKQGLIPMDSEFFDLLTRQKRPPSKSLRVPPNENIQVGTAVAKQKSHILATEVKQMAAQIKQEDKSLPLHVLQTYAPFADPPKRAKVF